MSFRKVWQHSIFLVHLCVSVCTYVGEHARARTCTHWPEVGSRCIFFNCFLPYFLSQSLSLLIWLDCLASKVQRSVCPHLPKCWDYKSVLLHLVAGDSNSNTHGCTASILSIKPPLNSSLHTPLKRDSGSSA